MTIQPMTSEQKPHLGDDGELHQMLDDPSGRQDAIFCVHCSAPNLPDAKFCNGCGVSLVEQNSALHYGEDSTAAKHKNNQTHVPRLATYDPSKYDLVRKQESSPWPIVMVIVVIAGILQNLPAAISISILFVLFIIGVIYGISRLGRSQ